MKQTVVNKSKKGFSLPLAIAISVFLILISSSLIFIAINSLSITSSDVSGRQAYMNAKSALEYARVYYEKNNSNYSSMSIQYMVMLDSGGTISNGAKIYNSENDAVKNATTYVTAEYNSGGQSGQATLKLRAFSKYSDAFGNRAKMVTVSGTFVIGGTSPNKLTVIARDQNPSSPSVSDTITLKVKQPKDMNYQLSYYVWTYKDPQHAYQNYKEADGDNSFEYEYKYKNDNGFINKLNAATMESNIVTPNGIWAKGGGGKQGPPAVMSRTTSNNAWISGDYVIKQGRVPWFNIIFAQKGSVLGDNCSNIYDSQTNEIFHLWYLDPNDKTIYFEFNGKKHNSGGKTYYTKYYTGKNWNGEDGLKDTILVYVKNIKTAVHFRAYGQDDKNTVTTLTNGEKPKISSIVNHDGSTINTSSKSYLYSDINTTRNKQSSGISMTYEGCGWWVANVETNKTFDVSISYKGTNYYASSITPSSQNDTWIVFRNGSLSAYATEKSALENGLGADPNEYVTVHAKIADYQKNASPKLSYTSDSWNSSAGMIELRNTIVYVSDVNEADFEAAAYQEFKDAKNEGITMLNTENFILNQPGANHDEKVKKADEKYRAAAKKIMEKYEALANHKLEASKEDIGALSELVNKGKDAEKAQNNDGVYDYSTYSGFIANSSPYKVAKKALDNNERITSDEVKSMISNLQASLDNLEANRLNRLLLEAYIKTAESMVNDTKYKQEARNALENALGDANDVYEMKNVSQSTIDEYAAKLLTKINETEAALAIDNTTLNELRAQAQNLLNAEKVNCTDQSYNALNAAYINSNNAASAETQQEVDNYVNELSNAIDKFTITKPTTSNDLLAQQNKINVWVVNKSGFDFDICKYVNSDDQQPNVETSIDMLTSSGYRYSEIDKTKFSMVSVRLTKEDGSVVAADPCSFNDVADGNIVFVIDETGNIKRTAFTTVFFPNIRGGITATVNGKTVEASYEAPYYVFRYVTENKDFTVNVKWTETSGTTHNDKYPMGKLTAGEFIAVPDEPNKNTSAVNVASVYPKYNNYTPETPEPNGIVATGNDYEIVNMSLADDVPGVTVGENQTCIILDASGGASSITGEGTPRIYVWNHSGKSLVSNDWNSRPEMKKSSKSNIYYYIVNDSNLKGLKVTKKYNEFSGDIIVRNDANDQRYKYVKLTSTGGNGFKQWKEVAVSANNNSNTNNNPSLSSDDINSITVGNNQSLIIVHCDPTDTAYSARLTNAGKAPKIYCWGGTSGGTLGYGWPGQEMQRLGNSDYYYHAVSSDVMGCKINYNNGAEYSSSGNAGNINLRSSSESSYKYYVLEPTRVDNRFNVTKTAYDNPPVIETPIEDIAAEDMTGTELSLAYVGGTKVRIENMGYYKIFGSGKKTNHYGYAMNDKALSGTDSNYYNDNAGGYMFGGDRENNNSGGRIGASQLLAYYDWYEFKIPVSKEANYTFELSGMNQSDQNRKTVQIKDAYGDVWLTQLDNSTTSGGRYSNIELLTFDPDDDTKPAVEEKLTVYFKMPEGWLNLSFSAYGPGGNDTRAINDSNRLQREANLNIYAITNISKNTPFITFKVNTGSGEKVYKTSLRGGYAVKFDPEAYGGNGDWVDFQSDQDALQEALKTVFAMYYGDVIVAQYDSNGEVIANNSGGDSYYYSEYLKQCFIGYANSVSSNGVDYYQLKTVDGVSEGTAYSTAAHLNDVISQYRELFKTMGDARSYFSTPITNSRHPGGGKYPEYLSRGSAKSYTTASLTTLKLCLEEAENAYLSGNNSNVVNATKKLRNAIDNMDTEDIGEIAVVLYDSQEKVEKGSSFKIRYRESPNGSFVTASVTDKNPEKFPIIFIQTGSSQNAIYDVQFLEGGSDIPLGSPIDKITKDDEAMVFVDTEDNPYWTVNSTMDYRDINSYAYEQGNSGEKMTIEMKSKNGSLKPLMLNFHYDTTVKRNNGTSYVIKAGEYYFENGNSGPFSSGKVDLFSRAAETYFTKLENYGYFTENTVTAQTMKWYYDYETAGDNNPGFKNGSTRTATRNVNFEVFDDMASITKNYPYEYSTTQGLNFRWSSMEDLKVTSKITLTAENINFAVNGGVIDGTIGTGRNKASGKNMFLFNKINSDSMDVRFVTDVTVKYIENGKEVQFTIYAGEYTIEKADPNQDYIANLFDKKYWKSMEHVFPKNKNGGGNPSNPGSKELVNPTYDD